MKTLEDVWVKSLPDTLKIQVIYGFLKTSGLGEFIDGLLMCKDSVVGRRGANRTLVLHSPPLEVIQFQTGLWGRGRERKGRGRREKGTVCS